MDEGTAGTLVPPRHKRGLREGFTTGACATAASLGATRALLSQRPVRSVEIHLPVGRNVTFALVRCEVGTERARCGVIKDGGDDPDATHGAEIVSTVEWAATTGLDLTGGLGVGVVTLPGLGLPVGGPAINPVPRRMIEEHVRAEVGQQLERRGLRIEIAVPDGERIALKTLNGRLGILGGISILGTTGIVKPWSTASWRASVLQAVDVAAANGQRHIVLCTGGRSERYAMRLFPQLQPIAFVEMGEFTGAALKRCLLAGSVRVTVAGMIGKLSKLANGHFMTHVAGNQVDVGFLATIGEEVGAAQDAQLAIRSANTARHVQEIVLAHGLARFFDHLTWLVRERSLELVGHGLAIDCALFDFEGTLLGWSSADPRPTL